MSLSSAEQKAVNAAKAEYYKLSGAAKDEFILGLSWAERHFTKGVIIAFAIGVLFGAVVF